MSRIFNNTFLGVKKFSLKEISLVNFLSFPFTLETGGNPVRHFQPNRTRYLQGNSNKTNFRDQTNDRMDRDGSHRSKPQSANGAAGSVPPSSSPNATSSIGSTSSTGTSTNSSANRENSKNSTGPFRNRESRDADEFSRYGYYNGKFKMKSVPIKRVPILSRLI